MFGGFLLKFDGVWRNHVEKPFASFTNRESINTGEIEIQTTTSRRVGIMLGAGGCVLVLGFPCCGLRPIVAGTVRGCCCVCLVVVCGTARPFS